MQFISISRPLAGFTEDLYVSLVEAEVQRARVLYSEGAIRQLWHRADGPGVCILWEANRVEDVREMLKTLPFARAGIVESTLVPLKPYIGFGQG
jgi:muconolactone delta-isomerase